MMNKSAIDWCDFHGTRHRLQFGCEYCYARRQATRFSGNTRLNMTNEQLKTETAGLYVLEQPFKNYNGAVLPFPAGFAPTFHKYRLGDPAKKKKPANISFAAWRTFSETGFPKNGSRRFLKPARRPPAQLLIPDQEPGPLPDPCSSGKAARASELLVWQQHNRAGKQFLVE